MGGPDMEKEELAEQKRIRNYQALLDLALRQLDDTSQTSRSLDTKASFCLAANGALLAALASVLDKAVLQGFIVVVLVGLLIAILLGVFFSLLVFFPRKWERFPELKYLHEKYWDANTSSLLVQCLYPLMDAVSVNYETTKKKSGQINSGVICLSISVLLTIFFLSMVFF